LFAVTRNVAARRAMFRSLRLHIGHRVLAAAIAVLAITSSARAADAPAMPTKAPAALAAYDWSGFYVGAHLGYAWGHSDWTARTTAAATPSISGSLDLFQAFDAFNEAGSFFAGVQAGYSHMFPNRFLLGVEVDASFPAWPNLSGISIGGTSTFFSPANGPQSYSETVLHAGTVRGRIGYAPGDWLVYATGGFAWTYNQLTLTQLANGTTESPFLWRLGWTAGAGVEVPVAPHWTAKLEYLFTDYGASGVNFPAAGQRFDSGFSLQALRAGLNYRFGDNATPASRAATAPATPDMDRVNFHGQATFVEQGYPSFRSPYEGQNSLPGTAIGRETFDATLYAGVRLWKGAELWIVPEIDQGFGVGNTHGAAGYTSGESYKLGASYPYARLQRAFVRQTIDLGGEIQKVDADLSQFAGSQSADRLVLTIGRFAVVDIFDTNKYATNPKTDFLNWSLTNAGTFDYAGDAWGYTYGAAAEWYQGRWTLRAGVFDLSQTPAGGDSPLAYGLDPTFSQFQLVGEIEERHELWGQPGKIKITGFLSRGRAGHFADAIQLAAVTGQPADINAVRAFASRPGVSLNIEQQVSETVGVFARAGWADGRVEPWDFTDIDRTISGGVSINGKRWGRPDDTIGIAGVVNGISGVHQAFLNAGGLGVLVGDGQLPRPGLEQIFEAYYSYALTSSWRLSVDYQLIGNPGYNTDRGPVNVFSGRVHWQF
jgi:high affinity Mn2+ porin